MYKTGGESMDELKMKIEEEKKEQEQI